MNPAFSIVFFTTLAGSSQGLVVTLGIAVLASVPLGADFLLGSLVVAELLMMLALGCSFLHLGHKMRAWRAVLMWRTSWMSREVIVLPAFIAVVGLWWLVIALHASVLPRLLAPVLAILVALGLWFCTAMIYACLRFVQEWAHPLTVVNYTAIGLSSGLVLAGALATVGGEPVLAELLVPWTLTVTVAAGLMRWASLHRNAALRPRSTVQSATGLRSPRVVQKAMGMTGGSFNTREFFHGLDARSLRHVKWGFLLFAFGLPVVLLLYLLTGGAPRAWLAALAMQFAGVVAERWFFFAEARHPQNLYYQTVS